MASPGISPMRSALNSSIFNGARLVGPALGALVAALGEAPCFPAERPSYVAVLVALARMGSRRASARGRHRRTARVSSPGCATCGARPRSRNLLLLLGVVSGLASSTTADAGVREDGPRHNAFGSGFPPYGGGVGAIAARAPAGGGAATPARSNRRHLLLGPRHLPRSPCSASGRAPARARARLPDARGYGWCATSPPRTRSSSWWSRTATAGG